MHWIVAFVLRWFLRFVLNVFFRRIVVDGLYHVPTDGPVVFVGNHQNQFVDGALILAYAPRTVHFLVAAKSYYGGGFVGFFSRVFGAIPVNRPQDTAKTGAGRIHISKDTASLVGEGTKFSEQLKPGDSIAQGEDVWRIATITDDTHALLDAAVDRDVQNLTYKILAKIDQSSVFAAVWSHLGSGSCIGIFPEGGSHDRANLLELKAGVTLMALGAMEKHRNARVSIVPIGLNYFKGHRFRGSALVEFGKPYKIGPDLVQEYSQDRRVACNRLLSTIKDQMQSVITTAPDLETLEALHLVRRLYTPSTLVLTTRQYLELSQRLLKGFQTFSQREDVRRLFTEVQSYRQSLQTLGLSDRHIEEESLAVGAHAALLVLQRFVLLFLVVILAGPATLLNAPIGIITRVIAKKHAVHAKESSAVKLTGADVLASKKLTTAAALTPVFWTAYTLIFAWAFGSRAAGIFVLTMPFFSYVSLRLVEEGLAVARSMWAMLKIKWIGAEIARLRGQRQRLAEAIRLVVTELGPLLAGTKQRDEFEKWRVVKEAQIEGVGNSKRGPGIIGRRELSFAQDDALEALIKDDEWEDLKEAWS